VSRPVFDDRRDAIDAILGATDDLAAARLGHGERVAQRLGLAPTDVYVLRRLATEGSMTVGRIGEVTGLTTGATTRLVDRLEQSGFVRRVADPADRRRVVVEAAGDRASVVADAFAPVEVAARAALEPLDDATLRALAAYLDSAATAYDTDGEAPTPTPGDAAPVAAGSATASAGGPMASAHEGRLVFVTAAPVVTIKGSGDLGPDLYRARFTGAIPSARIRDGIVTIRYPRLAWFDWRARIGDQWLNASAHWRKDRTDVLVNASVPWQVDLRGGATTLAADLRQVELAGFVLTGGSGAVTLALRRPSGAARIRFVGGTGDVTIVRPAGTAATLTIIGRVRRATLDGIEAKGSSARIATPDADRARDRYDIELHGGANRVVVRGE
jgi:DNA-binding MarR family transcriptional regulator